MRHRSQIACRTIELQLPGAQGHCSRLAQTPNGASSGAWGRRPRAHTVCWSSTLRLSSQLVSCPSWLAVADRTLGCNPAQHVCLHAFSTTCADCGLACCSSRHCMYTWLLVQGNDEPAGPVQRSRNGDK